MQRAVDKRKGLKCFAHAWMVVKIQTKHDDLINFFQVTIMVRNQWNELPQFCMRMTCDSDTNLIPELQIFMILIRTPMPVWLISILIPGFTKIQYSNSYSSSKWFSFQCILKNLILIQASCDHDSNANKPDFDSDSSIIYNSGGDMVRRFDVTCP